MIVDLIPDFGAILKTNDLGFNFQQLMIFFCALADVIYDSHEMLMQCGVVIRNETWPKISDGVLLSITLVSSVVFSMYVLCLKGPAGGNLFDTRWTVALSV